MKLAYIKNSNISTKSEAFNMHKFNVCLVIKKLLRTMLAMTLGITIPAIIFKSQDYMFSSIADGRIADFSGGVVATLSISTSLLTQLSYWFFVLCAILTIYKFLKTSDVRLFAKESLYLVLGYLAIHFLKLLPFVLPSTLRMFGII